MSENGAEPGISDDELPEDLQPTDDNPLAQPLDPDEAKPADELDMRGGKTPEQSDDPDDPGGSGDDSQG